jgi:hypothetical protein
MDWTIKPPEVQTPTEAAMQSLQLRNIAAQGQMHQLQMQQLQENQADDAQWKQAMGRHRGDMQGALYDVAGKVSPKFYFAAQEDITKGAKEKAATAKSANEAADSESDFFGRGALGVQRAGATPQALQAWLDTSAKAYPGYAQHAQQLWQFLQANPDKVQSTLDTIVAQSKDASAARLAQVKEDREKSVADSMNKERGVDTENKRTQGKKDKIVLSQFATLGMTQKDREDLDGQAATRAETHLRDIATDRNEQTRNNIAAGHLNLAQKKYADEAVDGSGKPMTANGRATNDRVLREQDIKLAQSEYAFHQQRLSLGAILATKDGDNYYDPTTKKEVAMDETKRAQLTQRFTAATNALNDVRGKRGLAPMSSGQQSNGGSATGNGSAGAGAQLPQPPAAVPPPAAATPPPPAKFTTQAVIDAYAKKKGITSAAAKAQAIAEGYQVK